MTKCEIELLRDLGHSPREIMEMTDDEARQILDRAESNERPDSVVATTTTTTTAILAIARRALAVATTSTTTTAILAIARRALAVATTSTRTAAKG
jgi:hypothetical protein